MMRGFTFALLVVAVACGDPVSEASTPPADTANATAWPAGNVVFYNAENLFDTSNDPLTNDDDFTPEGALKWTPERYRKKIAHLADALSWTGTDPPMIIGLSEVENRSVLDDLVKSTPLAGAHYTIVHHDSPDERGIDVALLVDPHWQVVSDEALPVPLNNDRTRDILHARLRTAEGSELDVFVCHWPSRREGEEKSEPKRMAAAKVVRDLVDAILKKDPLAAVLVMGDLNDHPNDESVRNGLGASCSPNDTHAALFDLMCSEGAVPDHGSIQFKGEWGFFDQFIVSRTLLAHAPNAHALWDNRLLFDHPKFGKSPNRTYSGPKYHGGYSDHLPVVMPMR